MKVYILMQLVEEFRYLDSIYLKKEDADEELAAAKKLSLNANTKYIIEEHEAIGEIEL